MPPACRSPLLIVVALGLGLLLGAINGLLVWKVGIPPIVVTLGTLTIYRGLAFVLSGGAWINSFQMTPGFLGVPRSRILGIPVLSWIAMLLIALAGVVFGRSGVGRAWYAVGGNPDGRRLCRHRCRARALPRLLLLRHCSSGLCGYLWVSRYAVAYVDVAVGLRARRHRRLRHRRRLDRGRHRLGSAASCSARCSSASSRTRCRS